MFGTNTPKNYFVFCSKRQCSYFLLENYNLLVCSSFDFTWTTNWTNYMISDYYAQTAFLCIGLNYLLLSCLQTVQSLSKVLKIMKSCYCRSFAIAAINFHLFYCHYKAMCTFYKSTTCTIFSLPVCWHWAGCDNICRMYFISLLIFYKN